jgi:hypothetical protein
MFRVDFHLTKPPIDVKAAFEDNTVTGLSTFKLNSISADKWVQYTVIMSNERTNAPISFWKQNQNVLVPLPNLFY